MKTLTYLIMFCMMICLCYTVGAIGISGGNLLAKDLIYHPDSEYHFGYTIIGSKTTVNNYEIYAKNDLKDYVIFDTPTHFENMPAGSNMPVNGRIIFPAEMPRPGKWDLFICGMEDCAVGGGSGACGRTAACAQMIFMVYHEGIYPKSSFMARDTNRGDPVYFTATVSNDGKEGIAAASGIVDVYSLAGEKVGSVDMETKPVRSGERVVMLGEMDTDELLPSNYTAFAHLDFDGIKVEHNDTFRVGNLTVNIVDYTKEIEAGGIRRFIVTVESEWNDPFSIFVGIQVLDERRQTIASLKTVTQEIKPWKSVDLEAFLDTTDIAPGEYTIIINAQFEGYTKTEEGVITVTAGSGQVQETGRSANESETPGTNLTLLTIVLVVVVLLLTFVNVLLVVYKRRRG